MIINRWGKPNERFALYIHFYIDSTYKYKLLKIMTYKRRDTYSSNRLFFLIYVMNSYTYKSSILFLILGAERSKRSTW